jgi:hypothetical protein
MSQSTKIAPPNSLLVISDRNGGKPPYPVWGAQILSTPSCVTVACYPSQDGETEVTLGAAHIVDPRTRPAFDSMLETPSHVVVVSTIEGETILREPVGAPFTRVRIWVNNPKFSDKVIIGLR